MLRWAPQNAPPIAISQMERRAFPAAWTGEDARPSISARGNQNSNVVLISNFQ